MRPDSSGQEFRGRPSRSGTRIGRPALAERLNGALDRGSLVLVAGAGYGKTMALEEALAARRAASAWIGCTDADRDAGHLLGRVLDVLRVAAPGAVDVLVERLAAAQEHVDVQAAVGELVGELGRLLVDPVVLVFDDAEWLQGSPDATALVGRLLAADAAALRIVVATRRPLGLRLAKLRGVGRVAQLDPVELAFSARECEALLRLRRDRPPTDSEVERLYDATEGWPLGAVLGAVHDGLPGLQGTSSRARLFEFLAEEVLERLPRELREHVIDSSVARELDRGCLRALGLPADFPAQVARAGLALRAVGSEPAWLAYHPLVREFLLERLGAQRTPQRRRALHARVAPALAGAGRLEDAVEQWLAAEEWPAAAEAIATAGPALLHTAPATLRRWLDALPADTRSSPSCLLLEGTLDWQAARLSEALARLRGARAGFARAGDVTGEWRARLALADPLWSIGEWEELIALADGFDERPALAAGMIAPAVAAYAAGALGAVGRVADCQALSRRLLAHPHLGALRAAQTIWERERLLLAGDLDELIGGAEEAVREFERVDPINRLPLLTWLLAVALYHQGRDAEALALSERVEALARQAHISDLVKATHCFRAVLHARAGRREAAEEQLARATVMTAAGAWREYQLEIARARIAALGGDFAAAVAASERALALTRRAALTDRFLAAIELAPVLLEAGQPGRAHALLDEQLALCDERVPGAAGSYFRSLLLGVRAALSAAAGDEAGAIADLERMWRAAGPNAADVLRREWPLLEPLLFTALERGALDPRAVLEAVAAARPGADALLAFTAHPDPRVRSAALAPAAASGHPDLIPRLAELATDSDPHIAAAARATARRLRATPPALTFTLFGTFGVRRASWHVEDAAWDRRVAQRLIRYLLVHRTSAVPDDLLLDAFWPGKPTDAARRSLRVAVSCARMVLDAPGTPSVIEVTERTLTLRLRDQDAVDVDAFLNAAATALDTRDGARRRLLERAAALWTAEPLPEERYADWASAWRERLTLRYAEVLTALAQACRADDDHPAATHAAHKLVQLDPLNEAAHRELMLAHARSGRRAHALRQYLECRRTLIDRLGLEPAAQTTQLQQHILAGEPV